MRKSTLTALILVLVLAITGVAYAAWTANVTINGTVNTGTFKLEFGDNPSSNDSGTSNDPGYSANVAQTEVTREADNLSLTVTVNNAYPGYHATITYTLKNAGSVPLKVTSVQKSGEVTDELIIDDTDAGLNEVIAAGAASGSHSITFTCGPNINQSSQYQFTVTITGSLYVQ